MPVCVRVHTFVCVCACARLVYGPLEGAAETLGRD